MRNVYFVYKLLQHKTIMLVCKLQYFWQIVKHDDVFRDIQSKDMYFLEIQSSVIYLKKHYPFLPDIEQEVPKSIFEAILSQ